MFYDSLIKDIAICLNTGEKELNRFLLHPSYRSPLKNDRETLSFGNSHQQIGFDSAISMLPVKVLDAIDDMLADAPHDLCGSCSAIKIRDYIKACTDLTDCHCSTLNTMSSIQ